MRYVWSSCTIAILWLTSLQAQTARVVLGPPGVIPLSEPQPPARLVVDEPNRGALQQGRVFIQYRAVNLRFVPVYGQAALAVTPRVGHIHISVDGTTWHWADASGEPLILVGLAPGPHKVEITLADPNHMPLDRRTISFVIPEAAHGADR